MAKLQRWNLISSGAKQGQKDAQVAGNRKASDKYRRGSILPKLPSMTRLPGGRIARRANNKPNLPGNGGGFNFPGGGGGIPSLHMLKGGLFKNHKAMHAVPKPTSLTSQGGSARVSPTKLPKKPLFKPDKPLPKVKLPTNYGSKQPKPMTSTKLPPLGPAQTTRPNFARGK